MSHRKEVIAVVGATGAQGGGLVRALLEKGTFAVRALTRDPASPKARELQALGAEVVAADVGDAASLERAFIGAHGAFCVTFFWAHFSPEAELEHARNMALAARAARVRHAIWSTLEDTRAFVPVADPRMPTLLGKYKVPHFDAKGEANALFRDLDVPTTFLNTSFYWDNLIHFGMGPRRGEDGVLTFVLPMGEKKLPGIASADIGACASALFERGPGAIGRTYGVAGEHLTGAEMAAALAHAFGEPVRYRSPTFAEYRAFGFPGAEDLGNMFQFKHDFEHDFCAARPVAAARALHPGLQTFDAWLAKNASRIPR